MIPRITPIAISEQCTDKERQELLRTLCADACDDDDCTCDMTFYDAFCVSQAPTPAPKKSKSHEAGVVAGVLW